MRYLLIVLFLAGCASQPGSGFGGKQGTPFVAFEPYQNDSGYIYIYRPDKIFWFKAYPNISINGKMVGELRNGTYIVAQVPEGDYSVVVHRNSYWSVPDSKIKLKVKAGENAFVEVEPNLENMLQVIFVLASTGVMAEATGIGIANESEFDGSASSSANIKSYEDVEPLFQTLLLSNKYHITPIRPEFVKKQ